jgi:hypothetical protein
MFIEKAQEVFRDINSQEGLIISNHIKDFIFAVETPYEWAMDKIVEFQKDLGISMCSIVSINDIVFCFGPLNIEPIKGDPETYKYKCFKTYAVFKKDSV